MNKKVFEQIIKNNKQIQINKTKYKEKENVRLQQILKSFNLNKIKRTRICKDCHLVKCIYIECRYHHMFNSLYLKREKKRKKAMTIHSEEGKRHLERLHREERERKKRERR